MNIKYNKEFISNAQNLRRNMTKEERRLWYDCLRLLPQKVVRQKVLGKYIVDFYCASAKIVIEVDGSQHYDEKIIEYDEERTKYIETLGFRVIRIPNNQVTENFNGVCQYIQAELGNIPSVTP